MWLALLGPLQVRNGEAELTVPAAKQRVLLATLLLHANHVVSFDELAETIWDGEPAPGANTTVRNYVRRLRQVLGPAAGARVVTRDPGYLIEVSEDELDLLRFDRLYRDGGSAVRAGDWRRASQALASALALWRGSPLADIPSERLRRDEVPPLSQARLQALEWHFDAELQLGRHADAVTGLEAASAKHPLRERFQRPADARPVSLRASGRRTGDLSHGCARPSPMNLASSQGRSCAALMSSSCAPTRA